MRHPETVRAIGILETGDFDVIRDLELPFPHPAPDEVLVRVEYGGVNFVDTYVRYACPHPEAPVRDSCYSSSGDFPSESFPAVLGTESTGEIVSLPTDPKVLNHPEYKKRGFKIGSKVAVVRTGNL
jgi:NADPH2:quinone reductase